MLAKTEYSRLKEDDEYLSSGEMKSFTISDDQNSNRRTRFSSRQKIFYFSIVFVTLVFVITLAVVFTQKKEWTEDLSTGRKVTRDARKLTLDDVLNGKFSYDTYSTTWVSDSQYIHENSDGLLQYDMNDLSRHTVISKEELKESNIDRVKKFSPDKNWFLFSNNSNSLYRHSFYADYYVKDMKTGEIQKIMTPTNEGDQIRYCGWSTNGSALVFVYRCNIFYVPTLDTDQMRYYQITKDGEPKKIFNGVPDWVYEEEIIASTHAIEFSANGKYLSYVNFNATAVPFYKFPRYGPATNLYTDIEKIAYPKAGYPNPTIKINIVNLESVVKYVTTPKVQLIPPIELSQKEFYYAVMMWDQNVGVFVQWMNRQQNNTICMIYEPDSNTGLVVENHKVKNGWVDDDYVKPYFSKDGSYYITMLPKDVAGGRGKYRHIAKVSTTETLDIEFLTDGKYTVQDLNCHNADEEMIYFRSTEDSPRHRQVYSLNINTKEKQCVSCGLIKDSDGTDCTYYYPQFSKKCSWVTLMCQGPFVPVTNMYGLKVKRKLILTSNNSTKNALREKDLPLVRYYTVESDGYEIPVRETVPYDFDKNKKYAVLFDVYGGPNTQKVTDKFSLRFPISLTSSDIVIVQFDARGSGYNGYKFLHAVYKKLGYYETVDALNVAKYLQKQSYVDSKRMAIWGWSYGAFYAANVLAESKGLINTAVSVAPVTDWRYYDTVYSERYMGFPSPSDNLKGYENTSIMSKASQFAGKNFLLIHGTADDNVHFQNTAQLSAALIKNKVKFRTQFFPDRDHAIRSHGYVYMLVADYLLAHLSGEGLHSGFARYTREIN